MIKRGALILISIILWSAAMFVVYGSFFIFAEWIVIKHDLSIGWTGALFIIGYTWFLEPVKTLITKFFLVVWGFD